MKGLLIGGLVALGAVAFVALRPKELKMPAIVSNALSELSKWAGVTETSPQGVAFVKEYWSGASQAFPSINDPWSAVFVSSQANKAIPGSLKLAQSHFAYAAQAYRDRGVKGRYGAYRPSEIQKLSPSDIIVRGRQGAHPRFEDLANLGGFQPTHGDIVTEIGPGFAHAVGGNVKNAVSQSTVRLSPSGQLLDPEVFTVLRYQA